MGIGQIGSRHLQGLLRLERSREIWAQDPSRSALELARKRACEIENHRSHRLHFVSDLNRFPTSLDLVLIATNSNVRFAVLSQLARTVSFKYLLLEKVLFPRLEEYEAAAELLQQHGIRTWVNCPLRMLPEYQLMRQHFFGKGPSVFTSTGNMWEMGSTAIHLYDLFAFLTGESEVDFQTDLLDEKPLTSKRKGYLNFTGTIYGRNAKGSFVRLTNNANPIQLMHPFHTISNAHAHFIIHRGRDAHYDFALASEGWHWRRGNIHTPFQSEQTHLFIEQIEKNGAPSLTSYKESSILHRELIEGFLKHMKSVGMKHRKGECKIT